MYAGATAGQGVGASASLGGDVNNGFGSGQAEAHAGGVSKSVLKTVSTNVETQVDSTQYQVPIATQSVATQAPVVAVPQVPQVVSQVDANVDIEPPYPPRTTPIPITKTTVKKSDHFRMDFIFFIISYFVELIHQFDVVHSIQTNTKRTHTKTKSRGKKVGPVPYLPPVVAPAVMPSPNFPAQGSGSSVSTSTYDADDNDLTHNTVPQTTNVVVQQPKPVDQQVIVTQTVPHVVNVQKIKVRPRPRPSTVCISILHVFSHSFSIR